MKIAFCTSPLKGGSKTRGVGAYTRELLAALRTLYPHDQFVETIGDPYSVESDIVHYPFFDPFFLTLPWRFTRKTIITIHDLIPLKYPPHFKPGIRGRIKWYIQKSRARHADAIITDSRSSARDIHRLMDIPEPSIHVVPLSSATSRAPLTMRAKVKKLYHVPDKCILYVGDINWNKNIAGLIDAFGRLQDASTHLVLVGKVFSDAPDIPEFRAIREAIRGSGKADRIHLLGYIPSHHLVSLYRLATLYCQPSWDEGFGLPILEAMQAGCPVLSSNRGSLREVGGDAVWYFDPDKDELSAKLKELLASDVKRTELQVKGYAQAKRFTWAKTAQRTMEVYRRI